MYYRSAADGFGYDVIGMVYFTSDLHFGHSGIIAMQNRPFSDVEEMNRDLLRNCNSYVHKNDTVYILGDVCHHLPMDRVNDLIGRMNGKKILIRRNHDKKYDVGVDANQFCPVSVNQVLDFFKGQQ
ncbi:MAG: metallophosphoesterase [Lachnospiraceae bacterium]|nr:metallophosphoesterase [Lachnospiraceae bacterium]